MALLDVQRRAYEIGRLRIGVQIPTGKDGKSRPAKLDRFRFTSRDEYAIRAVAALYGGEVQHWDGAPTDDQWEVITAATELPVSIPPGPQAVSQFYEMWSGGGCRRRCDGFQDRISGGDCLCPSDQGQRSELAKTGRACKPTTRVSVILPDVPGLGVWRLESHGWNAAHELGMTAELLSAVMSAGGAVPAVLRLEKRRQVSDGKTKEFVVPVLALRSTMRELKALGEAIRDGAALPGFELPPAPAARAIEAAPTREDSARTGAPGLPSWPPESPQDLAKHVEACAALQALDDMARSARKVGWMDEFVASRYSPDPDEVIELVEVFRGRQAELQGGGPS